MKNGVLLINLGTPDEPTVPAVRRYLKEFLSDPYVIDINPLARWLLVNCIIGPFRSPKSTLAYKKIWTDRGSPLLFHTMDLTKKVAEKLGSNFAVETAMRYGNPGLKTAIARLVDAGVHSIKVFPLYPQYALSSTETSLQEASRILGELRYEGMLDTVGPFYGHAGFIRAFAETGRPVLTDLNPDHVVFSFHGLPERHIRKVSRCPMDNSCCETISEHNRLCYRAHCVQTARAIAQESALSKDQYTISFQSRLGRTPWIKPYTDLILPELARQGKKRIAVFCPSFVADCLETLEEIAIRGKESFLATGGERLALIPSLNSHPSWVEAICEMITSPSTHAQNPPAP
ncbi:MAG: ferrochelatase [Deltaproteobacteria bacterium]|nr:ferrochelatase [Deltaproteobacteria bacterium]